jgi:hypothetical protein
MREKEREKLRPNLIYTNTFLFWWEHLIKRKLKKKKKNAINEDG